MTLIDIQLSPARTTWPRLRGAVLEAEQRGFAACWALDHLGGVALGGHTMLECFTLLGALAEATSTIELGTLVANVWNRQPGTLVSAAASVALVSGRQFHLGLGAGTSPTSGWAAEQHAVGHDLEPDLAMRHARVEEVLALCEAEWGDDRDGPLATFPLPRPRPTTLVGVNSTRLARIAGRAAGGINVPWTHPRRDELIAAAVDEAGGRPFARTVFARYDEALLDGGHPDRVAMTGAGIDRLILLVLGEPPF